MKFIADRMLGRLARWLRLLGYDTLEIKRQENEDELLMELAEAEGRILLSRDRTLIRNALKKGIDSYEVLSSEITEQLVEMHKGLDIQFEIEMERCSLCNSGIRRIPQYDIELVREKEYVHPEMLERGTEFWVCDNCGQVYWQGSHWENIKERVERLKELIRK